MRKSLRVYVIAYLTLLLVVCGLLCLYPKLELHLLLNSWHTRIQDTFFKYYTMIAEDPSTPWDCSPYCGGKSASPCSWGSAS